MLCSVYIFSSGSIPNLNFNFGGKNITLAEGAEEGARRCSPCNGLLKRAINGGKEEGNLGKLFLNSDLFPSHIRSSSHDTDQNTHDRYIEIVW